MPPGIFDRPDFGNNQQVMPGTTLSDWDISRLRQQNLAQQQFALARGVNPDRSVDDIYADKSAERRFLSTPDYRITPAIAEQYALQQLGLADKYRDIGKSIMPRKPTLTSEDYASYNQGHSLSGWDQQPERRDNAFGEPLPITPASDIEPSVGESEAYSGIPYDSSSFQLSQQQRSIELPVYTKDPETNRMVKGQPTTAGDRLDRINLALKSNDPRVKEQARMDMLELQMDVAKVHNETDSVLSLEDPRSLMNVVQSTSGTDAGRKAALAKLASNKDIGKNNTGYAYEQAISNAKVDLDKLASGAKLLSSTEISGGIAGMATVQNNNAYISDLLSKNVAKTLSLSPDINQQKVNEVIASEFSKIIEDPANKIQFLSKEEASSGLGLIFEEAIRKFSEQRDSIIEASSKNSGLNSANVQRGIQSLKLLADNVTPKKPSDMADSVRTIISSLQKNPLLYAKYEIAGRGGEGIDTPEELAAVWIGETNPEARGVVGLVSRMTDMERINPASLSPDLVPVLNSFDIIKSKIGEGLSKYQEEQGKKVEDKWVKSDFGGLDTPMGDNSRIKAGSPVKVLNEFFIRTGTPVADINNPDANVVDKIKYAAPLFADVARVLTTEQRVIFHSMIGGLSADGYMGGNGDRLMREVSFAAANGQMGKLAIDGIYGSALLDELNLASNSNKELMGSKTPALSKIKYPESLKEIFENDAKANNWFQEGVKAAFTKVDGKSTDPNGTILNMAVAYAAEIKRKQDEVQLMMGLSKVKQILKSSGISSGIDFGEGEPFYSEDFFYSATPQQIKRSLRTQILSGKTDPSDMIVIQDTMRKLKADIASSRSDPKVQTVLFGGPIYSKQLNEFENMADEVLESIKSKHNVDIGRTSSGKFDVEGAQKRLEEFRKSADLPRIQYGGIGVPEFPKWTGEETAEIVANREAGLRWDGSKKGEGWLGRLKRPDGGYSTEVSIGVDLLGDGNIVEIPSITPNQSDEALKYILSGREDNPKLQEEITRNAFFYARRRVEAGRSQWKD